MHARYEFRRRSHGIRSGFGQTGGAAGAGPLSDLHGRRPGPDRLPFVSLKNLIERAYSIKSYQVFGPDWLESERFDVTAKLPEGATQADVPKMLQALLAERFKLTVHHERDAARIRDRRR